MNKLACGRSSGGAPNNGFRAAFTNSDPTNRRGMLVSSAVYKKAAAMQRIGIAPSRINGRSWLESSGVLL